MATTLDIYNISERFFVLKILDLYYMSSIDSYRVRYNNANTSLNEVYRLLKDWMNGRIKRYDTVRVGIEELIDLLKKDSILVLDITKKKDLIDLLFVVAKSEGKSDKNDVLKRLDYILHHIISTNTNYQTTLFDKVKDSLIEIDEKDTENLVKHFIDLSEKIEILATELLNNGYSKIFLYQLISRTFNHTSKHRTRTFTQRWEFFKNVVYEKKEKEYVVTFRFNIHIESSFIDHFEKSVSPDTLPPSNPRTEVISFIRENPSTVFKSYNVKALDFYQAIRAANERLSNFLDVLHFSYNDVLLNLNPDVLVVDQAEKEKANIQKIYYLIDGGTLSQGVDFSAFNSLIDEINQKEYISDNVKDKIRSAIRYLRMGNEAIAVEQKYICYWIALEHIFSVHEKESSTFERMYIHFANLEIIYYLKRNILYLHNEIKKNIETISLAPAIIALIEENNLLYISNEAHLDALIAAFVTENPLLAFKLNRIKSVLHAKDKIEKYIKNHEKNVNRHLVRLYRVRNELMHDAAIIPNIENLTSNLKYYLTFTLSLLLRHFSNCELNGRLEKEIDLQDFFNRQSMLLDFVIRKYDKDEILKIDYQITF